VFATASVQLGHGHPVALPVITFAQSPVIQHRDRGGAEGSRGCLGSAGQVGAEHDGDPVIQAAAPQLLRLRPALFGQLAEQPARGAAQLAVPGRGVGLTDQLDGHQPTLRTCCGTPRVMGDRQGSADHRHRGPGLQPPRRPRPRRAAPGAVRVGVQPGTRNLTAPAETASALEWISRHRGLLPPSPAPPGSSCPQLHRPAAIGGRRRSLTSTRTTAPHGANRRSLIRSRESQILLRRVRGEDARTSARITSAAAPSHCHPASVWRGRLPRPRRAG
jgi:hypothetical protein